MSKQSPVALGASFLRTAEGRLSCSDVPENDDRVWSNQLAQITGARRTGGQDDS